MEGKNEQHTNRRILLHRIGGIDNPSRGHNRGRDNYEQQKEVIFIRLWHYKLLPYLPKSQLLAQWRELNSIFKKQDKHILINYVYEYPNANLQAYAELVMQEMDNRNFRSIYVQNFIDYFGLDISYVFVLKFGTNHTENPFPNHHTNRYLIQCFYNLQEKYDRGQKDFSEEQYRKLEEYVMSAIEKEGTEAI